MKALAGASFDLCKRQAAQILLQNRPHLQLALKATEDEAVLLHVCCQDHLDHHLAQPSLHKAGITSNASIVQCY